MAWTYVPGLAPLRKVGVARNARWFARPVQRHARSLLDIPVSAACMKDLLRFCMGCHRLPRDEGSWARPAVPRLERICQLCASGTVGNEKHLIFECLVLQCLTEQWSHLFEGPQTMQAFMWQDDPIGVAKYVDPCVLKIQPPGKHLISLMWLEEM